MVSCISKFNDPFEVMYRPVGEMTRKIAREYVSTKRFLQVLANHIQNQNPYLDRKSALRQAKGDRGARARVLMDFEKIKRASLESREELIDRVLRVACFTNADKVESKDEILMWSHYAKGHFGIRLGFEFPPDITSFYIREIVYSSERIELDITLLITDRAAFEKRLVECNQTKGAAWSYEREVRLFTHPKFCHREACPGGDFVDFIEIKANWLRAVDFGARCPESERTAVAELIRVEYPNAVLRQAKYHPTDYALCYEPF